MEAANDNLIEGDLLMGAKAIAAFLGVSPRQAYRLCDGIVPSFHAGGTICARRSSLARWMSDAEKAA